MRLDKLNNIYSCMQFQYSEILKKCEIGRSRYCYCFLLRCVLKRIVTLCNTFPVVQEVPSPLKIYVKDYFRY